MKESRSRVTNTKVYEENFDEIFRNGKKISSSAIKIDKNAKNDVWGKVTRYHYKKETEKFDDAPSVGKPKATVESSMENYKIH